MAALTEPGAIRAINLVDMDSEVELSVVKEKELTLSLSVSLISVIYIAGLRIMDMFQRIRPPKTAQKSVV